MVSVIQGTVGPHGVVLLPVHHDQDLSFLQSVEDLPIQQLVSDNPIDRFKISILLGVTQLDEQHPDWMSDASFFFFFSPLFRGQIQAAFSYFSVKKGCFCINCTGIAPPDP
jgi:hypothetical protein